MPRTVSAATLAARTILKSKVLERPPLQKRA